MRSTILNLLKTLALLVVGFVANPAVAQGVETPGFLKRMYDVFPDDVAMLANESAVPLWTVVSNGDNPEAGAATWCASWLPVTSMDQVWSQTECWEMLTEASAALYGFELPVTTDSYNQWWRSRPPNFTFLVPSFAADRAVMMARIGEEGDEVEMVADLPAFAVTFQAELDRLRSDVAALEEEVGDNSTALASVEALLQPYLDAEGNLPEQLMSMLVDFGLINRDGTLAVVASSQELTAKLDRLESFLAGEMIFPHPLIVAIRSAALADFGDRLEAVETRSAENATALGEVQAELAGEGDDPLVRQSDLQALRPLSASSDLDTSTEEPVAAERSEEVVTPADAQGDAAATAESPAWWQKIQSWWQTVATTILTIPVVALVLAILALILGIWLVFRKATQSDLDDVKTTAMEAKEKAQSAKDTAGGARADVGTLTDRVRDVEELQILLLTLDAQGRFNNPDLTDQRLKDLGGSDSITLEVKCLDGYVRKVRVSKGVSSDGKPRLYLHGLEKGHDFIDTISLKALYRHLAKARQEGWIIGLTAADKAAA